MPPGVEHAVSIPLGVEHAFGRSTAAPPQKVTTMTLAEYEQQAAQVRAIPDDAERKAALALLASILRRIAWNYTVRAAALDLAATLAAEADAIDADELSGLDSLAARGAVRPL